MKKTTITNNTASIDPKELAKQLRKPEGETGIAVANKLNETNAFITRFTFDLMDIQTNDHILEIGFGNGAFIRDIVNKARNVSYWGIDISDVMVEEAVGRNKKLIAKGIVNIKKSGLEPVPYDDETFDRIVTINTIYFWENPGQNAREIYRVLKKNGKLFISIRPRESVKDMEFTKYGFNLYTVEEARALLEQAGFRDFSYIRHSEPDIILDGKSRSMRSLYIMTTK
ncbi:MAG: class I SAM-dependent methyltransferase [bacterium]|nr:class I SAM-dependent methyltransferase [bacterium]